MGFSKYLIGPQLEEAKTEELPLKNHCCNFNQTFNFDINLEMDGESFELKSNYIKLSVKGQSKKSRNAQNIQQSQINKTSSVNSSKQDGPDTSYESNEVSRKYKDKTTSSSTFGHYDDIKVGFADIDLACFATGQQLQATYWLSCRFLVIKIFVCINTYTLV